MPSPYRRTYRRTRLDVRALDLYDLDAPDTTDQDQDQDQDQDTTAAPSTDDR